MLPKVRPAPKPIYLDHAATTYLDPRVEKAMQPFWQQRYGNPSSLYKQGKAATEAVHQARAEIAAVLRSKPEEIIFTAGGTESINLAIFGVARAFEIKHKRPGHIISTTIEHHAVLHSLAALKEEGWSSSLVPVDAQGFIDLNKLKKAIKPNTVLISVMYANNEIGTIEPISQIGKWLRQLNAQRAQKKLPRIYFHTDACQATGSLDLDINRLGVDLLSANGSKIYGPKQTGFLYVRTGTLLRPIIFGGGQEKNLRSGTQNVPGIVGLAKALQLVQANRLKENKRLRALRDYFMAQLLKKVPQLVINGPGERGVKDIAQHPLRLPNNISVSILGVEGETLLLYLDSYNIAVSTGSACATTSTDPSHVILALGKTPHEAYSAVRFTLGKQTTKQQLDFVLATLPSIVKELRVIF